MSAPRIEIDLDKIRHNALSLVEQLSPRGISITGVTKAYLGSPEIATTLLQAGIHALGDSRIQNLETMRCANVDAAMMLIRSPMLSQVDQVVDLANVSFNTELDVIRGLSDAACKTGRDHGVVLMIELGDLREGIMPNDLESIVRQVLSLPNIQLKGIGANLACRSGVSPSACNMAELSDLANAIERTFDIKLDIISGGNSGNLQWALSGAETGRINNLRLGEALLLGCETLQRQRIEGLYTDAFILVAEVIESKIKPAQPWGEIAQTAFGEPATPSESLEKQGFITQTILAIGLQDTDTAGLQVSDGMKILGASSDHLIIDAGRKLPIGTEIRLQLNYSSLVRAMTSPFVAKVYSDTKLHNVA